MISFRLIITEESDMTIIITTPTDQGEAVRWHIKKVHVSGSSWSSASPFPHILFPFSHLLMASPFIPSDRLVGENPGIPGNCLGLADSIITSDSLDMTVGEGECGMKFKSQSE